ncbi:uncharacterized protein V1516DRAFT_226873 [Lipomyces oligophaga]|uniref:uncharacterized protein n=1 Tax=Lipomyces oligophaga TaxID=45792 RepID=UPI0034CDF379
MAIDIHVLGPPNADFVIGYPGIAATKPRIAGTVHLDASSGSPFVLYSLTIQLERTVKVSMGLKLLSEPKTFEHNIGNPLTLYTYGTNGPALTPCYSMQFPFTYRIVDQVLPGSLDLRSCKISYKLRINVAEKLPNGIIPYEVSVPITLTSYGKLFDQTISDPLEYVSEDGKYQFTLQMDGGPFGPGDSFLLGLHVSARSRDTLRVRKVNLALKRVITIDGSIAESETISSCAFENDSVGNFAKEFNIVLPLEERERLDADSKQPFFERESNGSANVFDSFYSLDCPQCNNLSVGLVISLTVRCNSKDMTIEREVTYVPVDSGAREAILGLINSYKFDMAYPFKDLPYSAVQVSGVNGILNNVICLE